MKKPPMPLLEEFRIGSQCQSGEEAQRADQQHDENQQEHKHGVGVDRVPAVGRSSSSPQAARDGYGTDDGLNRTNSITKPWVRVEEDRVGVKARKRRPVVAAGDE